MFPGKVILTINCVYTIHVIFYMMIINIAPRYLSTIFIIWFE